MYLLQNNGKTGIKVVILIICLGLGLLFAKIYQPQQKTEKIYKNALNDYNNGNYSNAYYLFSKVSYTSKLKPAAIYRQALCAKALGDDASELKNYRHLFNNFPNFKLSPEARYLAGQILIDENPNLAYKYFNKVAKSNIDEDFKTASEYYKAKINASKIRYSNKIFSRKKAADIEKSFRNYLVKYPDGRLAVSTASTWKKFNPNIKSKDAVLLARAYYLAGNYKEAASILSNTTNEDNWAIAAVNAYSQFDYEKTKKLTEEGVVKYSKYVDENDYVRAVDTYMSMFEPVDKYKYASKLFSKAKGKGRDYIQSEMCNVSPNSGKKACYEQLYSNYPEGKYAQNALLQLLIIEINNKDFANARNTAKSFLTKYTDSDYIPFVMFWAGKIEQKYHNTMLAAKYYQYVVNNYPDSYYAYRAYWILKGAETSVINTQLDYKPVVYPYKYPAKDNILYELLAVEDYDMLVKFTGDDFIKSWVEYKKGNYAKSVVIARDAMAGVKFKPVKSDLRWRLVYPRNYYKQVKSAADLYKNNDALMIALIREESYFNPQAQSAAGAIGLMQLMPATAHDVGSKHSIEFNTSSLVNPELNIKLGNIYYSTIREILDNKDVSAIAAYNGGIGSVSRWKTTLKYNDTDEFVEQIPYDETKNYIKKVFKSYWNYTRIYQRR